MKLILAALTVAALLPSAAAAYPTMIRHGYTQCSACHTDPSGGTLLTNYGRAQSELLLSTRWGAAKAAPPSAASKFLFGVLSTPEALTLGGWVREGYIWNDVDGKLVDHRQLQMRTSIAADLRLGPLRAAAELGYASAGTAELAAVTRNQDSGNLVSREHWIGVDLAGRAALLRGGRINVPFGLRNLEHSSFVRTATRTDINEDQQGGVAVAVAGESWRMESMAMLGNYSLHPDELRERGFSGYFEAALSPRATVGLSALLARADVAPDTGSPTLRQAYGLTARVAPWTPLVLSAELDALLSSQLGSGTVKTGHSSWLQADLEVFRGMHLVSAGEHLSSTAGGATRFGVWGGAAWFVVPHLDVRADVIHRFASDQPTTDTFLVQLNGYL